MEIPIQEIMRIARESVQFNEQQFEVDDDGVRKTVSVTIPEQSASSTPLKIAPLEIRASKPAYIAAPTSSVASGFSRYYIEWGSVNGIIANNWNAYFDINSSTYFFAKALFSSSSELKVASWTIETGTDYNSHETPEWGDGATRPPYAVALLGQVYLDSEGNHHILPDSKGSLQFTEHLTNISSNGSYGAILLQKKISYHRLTY